MDWIKSAILVTVASAFITLGIDIMFYRKETIDLKKRIWIIMSGIIHRR